MGLSQPAKTQRLNLPVASSQNLGWNSLLVEEYRQPSGGMKFQAELDPAIVLVLTSKPHRIHEAIGEHRHVGMYCQGHLSITPSNMPSSCFVEDKCHYLYVKISSDFIQAITEDYLDKDRDKIRLVPVFQARNLQLEHLLRLLQIELHQGGRRGHLYLDSLAHALAINLLQDYSATAFPIVQSNGGLGDHKLLQVTRYIDEALDQDIKLADLAQLVGVSQSHFSRLFKQSTGLSPHQYLLQQRVERAKQLLKYSGQSLVDIALACGFDSHSHFSRQFRKITGTTPTNFRKN